MQSDIKQYLMSYRALDKSINQKLDELARLKAKAEKNNNGIIEYAERRRTYTGRYDCKNDYA